MATYDPVSTATALAENYVYARQLQLSNSESKVQEQTSALSSLRSSLSTFTTALTSMSGKGSVIAQTSSVSNTAVATASAGSTAAAGKYTFEVERLASSQQTLYELDQFQLKDAELDSEGKIKEWPVQPTVAISVGSSGFFTVDLSQADTDGDGKLSVTEVARAINASGKGDVSAAVITDGGQQKLLLNAGKTGSEGAFEVHILDGQEDAEQAQQALEEYMTAFKKQSSTGTSTADAVNADDTDQAEVSDFVSKVLTPIKTLAQAQDAVLWVGGKNTGLKIEQSNNTYSGIDGLNLEFKAVTAEPLTVTIAKDETKTKSNMESFVSAYNTLVGALDKLTASGNAEKGVKSGALASDSGVRSLRNMLNSLMRSTVDGVSLTDFGISAQRDGTIALNSERFAKKVAEQPEALEKLLGQTNSLEYKRSGVLGSLQTYVQSWTKSAGGILQSRQDNLQKQQKQLDRQQESLERLYEQAYNRYLNQFSALAGLENQMSSTSSMLTAMFNPSTKTS